MDTEKFIKLVRERRCLYRKKTNDITSRRRVAETWLEIARLMGTGNGKQWAIKWKGLKDCFKKFKNAKNADCGEACRKYKHWPWAKHMKFLDHDTMQQTTGNMDNEIKIENTDNMASQDSDDDNFSHSDTIEDSVYPQNAASDNYSCPPGTSNSVHFEDTANEMPFEAVMVINNTNGQRNKISTQKGDSDAKLMLKYLQENLRDIKPIDDIDQLFASYATSLKKMPTRIQSMIKLDIATLFAKYEFQVEDQSFINIKCEAVESD